MQARELVAPCPASTEKYLVHTPLLQTFPTAQWLLPSVQASPVAAPLVQSPFWSVSFSFLQKWPGSHPLVDSHSLPALLYVGQDFFYSCTGASAFLQV